MKGKEGLGWKEPQETNRETGEMKKTEEGQSQPLGQPQGSGLVEDKGGVCGVETARNAAAISKIKIYYSTSQGDFGKSISVQVWGL